MEQKQNFCKMLSLVEQVYQLLESEPDTDVLKEQILFLIETIKESAKDCKINYKERLGWL